MILDPKTPRCQGRPMGNTMARECWNCVRRTDVPADVKSVAWWPQLPKAHAWFGCESYIAPAEEVIS